LALDELHHLPETRIDALVEVTPTESRRNGLGNDAVRHGIGEYPLETIAHLDAYAMVVLGDEQQRAVIDLLATDRAAPELPLLDDSYRILLDLLRTRRRHDEHRELRTLAGLESRELLLERGLLFGGERASEIGHPGGEWRNRLQARGRGLCARMEAWSEQQRSEQR